MSGSNRFIVILHFNTMLTHKVHLDTQNYSRKPSKSDGKKINNRLVHKATELSIEEIAKKVVQPYGRAWITSHFEGRRKNENWKSSSIFALDFDEDITFDKVLERLREYRIECCFAYNTFSDTPNTPKFRVAFQLEEPITDPCFRKTIQLSLEALFPEIDKSCKDPNRIFYGGKSLLYQKYDAFLDIEKLIDAAQFHSIKDKCGGNMNRDLKRKQKKLGISQNGGKSRSLYNNSIGSALKSSIFDPKALRPKIVRNVDFNHLRQQVKILDDFMNPNIKLLHPELLGLATNLQYLEGGQQLFHNCIDANPDYDAEEKHKIMRYCKTQKYLPMRLRRFSPYKEDFGYGTLLQAAKVMQVIRIEEHKRISIEDARTTTAEKLNSILESDDTDVHVVKVPTGVGKTELCTFLENVVISFPNHALKQEVSGRMKVEHQSTPGLDSLPDAVQRKLDYYYSIGAISEANNRLQDLAEENDDIANYLKDIHKCYASEGTILTTHQKALFIDWSHNTIIFDEDPISIVLAVGQTTLNDLIQLGSDLKNETLKQIVEGIAEEVKQGSVTIPRTLDIKLRHKLSAIVERVLDSSTKYSSNILHFCDAEYFVADYSSDDPDNIPIHFIKRHSLPENKKIIILSATADETMYRYLVGDRLQFHDIGQVETTGVILQDMKYSCSRASLSEAHHLEYVKDEVQNLPVITFRSFKDQFSNPVTEAHFGKTTGFDGLKGRDIAVVGTPHPSPITLKLMARVLGLNVSVSDLDDITQRQVWHNGFRFWFNTYANEDLKNLQFFYIETDLRQAVGRARVNTEAACAYLYSNYPLPEACITYEERADGKQRIEAIKQQKALENCFTKSADLQPAYTSPNVVNKT